MASTPNTKLSPPETKTMERAVPHQSCLHRLQTALCVVQCSAGAPRTAPPLSHGHPSAMQSSGRCGERSAECHNNLMSNTNTVTAFKGSAWVRTVHNDCIIS